MKPRFDFAEAAAAGIVESVAYAHPGGQPYRLVFAFRDGRHLTLQSDLTGGNEEIGFLVFEERVYAPDSRSLKTEIPLGGGVSSVTFYVVDGCEEPSRVSIELDTGQRLTVSSDAFPYGIAYEFGDTKVGLAQYDNTEYRIAK